MRAKNIRALYVKPYEEPKCVVIEDTLDSMQYLVGGYIQATRPLNHDDTAVIICNEEGKLLHLPLNRPLFHRGEAYDIIRGNFLVVDSPVGSDGFESLSDEQVTKYAMLYGLKERSDDDEQE